MSNKNRSLPNAKTGQISNLLEKLELLGGRSDKEGLAVALDVKTHTIKNTLKAAEMLGCISIDENEIKLTEVGRRFVDSNENERKVIFREQMLKIEPFITISRALQKQKELESGLILRLVKAKIKAARKWKPSTEKEMLRMIINWGKYSQLFSFDTKSRKLFYLGAESHGT